ncbi:hypothetical protein OAQ05_01380 [Acidimicrobiia bacterium]|nr:hypothetical protein [Acidimicrobiia bacterium]
MSEIARAGRPSKVKQVDLDLLCTELESGVTIMSACQKVGISVRLFNKWRLLGQDLKEEEVFQNFYHRTELARATAQNNLLDIVINNAQQDPKSAMWLLERMYPEDFSLKDDFRKTKEDIKKENFGSKTEYITISFGESPQEMAIQRRLDVSKLEKFLEKQNLVENLGIPIEELLKIYESHLATSDKGTEELYKTMNDRSIRE